MTEGHKLPAEVHERIYREISAAYLARSQPRDAPVAIITGGQPGAGKSGLTSQAKAELAPSGGFVLIDADKLRSWHPEYARLLREDDRTAANKTHGDAGRWASRLAWDAVAQRRNVIFDQTSKDGDALGSLADRLHAAGYQVHLRVMAVHERVSEQRIYMRYEVQKAQTGHGRFATRENHDLAFNGVLATVAAVEGRKQVDGIRVHDKDHRVIYANELLAGDWVRPPAAATVMRAERGRPLTVDEAADVRRNYETLAVMVARPERQASPQEQHQMQQLLGRSEREHLAAVFRQDREGSTRPSELLGAYDLLVAVTAKARAEGLAPGLLAEVVVQAREMLAKRIELGEVTGGRAPADRAQQKARDVDRGPER